MNRSCYVFDPIKKEKLDSSSAIPMVQPNRIRRFNSRPENGDAETTLTAKEFVQICGNQTLPDIEEVRLSSEVRVRLSSDVAAQLMCHDVSSSYNQSLTIKDDGKEEKKDIHILAEKNSWANFALMDEKRMEVAIKIGKLAEKALSSLGDGIVSVQSSFPSIANSEKYIRLVEREVDTIYKNGSGKLETAEIKCVGQLTMSKERLFNSRLFPLICKAIASRSGATFVVVRDDREMDLDNLDKSDLEQMPILEVLYWENVCCLINRTDYEHLVEFHGTACATFANYAGSLTGVKNNKEEIQVCTKKGNAKLSCKASIPKKFSYEKSEKKKMNKAIIIGPGIPYFDFRLSDFYMIYRHKYIKDWSMRQHFDEVLVIANTVEDLKAMFQNYKRHYNQERLKITFLTHECLSKNNALITNKFNNDDITYKQFINYNDLGEYLYNEEKLTYWEKPIPACLLLLGNKQHVPLKMITSRLWFGIINGDTTKIDLTLCSVPDLVAVIGTEEECKNGNKLIREHFPEMKIHLFCPTSSLPMTERGENKLESTLHVQVEKNGLLLTMCLPRNLEVVMKEFGFPMYKDFKYHNGQWIAE